MSYPKFVISRLWRDGNVSIPTSEKIIKEGDRLLVVTSEKDALALTVLFGEQETYGLEQGRYRLECHRQPIDFATHRRHPSRIEREEAGSSPSAQSLRNQHQPCLPFRRAIACYSRNCTLQLGDRLTVVGEAAAIQNVEKVLGKCHQKPERTQSGGCICRYHPGIWLWELIPISQFRVSVLL